MIRSFDGRSKVQARARRTSPPDYVPVRKRCCPVQCLLPARSAQSSEEDRACLLVVLTDTSNYRNSCRGGPRDAQYTPPPRSCRVASRRRRRCVLGLSHRMIEHPSIPSAGARPRNLMFLPYGPKFNVWVSSRNSRCPM